MYEYRCRVVDVYDGDTLTLAVDLGFHVTNRIKVRLLNIDTPEVRGPERPEGLVAKQFVQDWVNEWEAQLPMPRDGKEDFPFVVRTQKTGKYGRWLADLRPDVSHELYVELFKRDQKPSLELAWLTDAIKAAGHDTEDWKNW